MQHPITSNTILKNLMDEFLKEDIDYGNLEKKCFDFRSYLLGITDLDLNDLEDRKDLEFENGIALCTTFAALCTHDIIRTRQFVRGIYQAIIDRKEEKSDPIHIFYAGTGPFATLVLPILTKFSSDEIQLTLLDVNEKTLDYLKKTIEYLSLEDFIQEIICSDATSYKFEKNKTIDILISETMQHALVKEQQVPIMMNLVSQLPENTIVIPNNIRLELALQNTNVDNIIMNRPELYYQKIDRLWDFSSSFMRETKSNKLDFLLCEKLNFRECSGTWDQLVVLTEIQVYKDEWIRTDKSGLTIPRRLFQLKNGNNKNFISVRYLIKEEPDFEYQLS